MGDEGFAFGREVVVGVQAGSPALAKAPNLDTALTAVQPSSWSNDLPNFRRLASIDNTGLSTGQYSNFAYTTTPENFITAIGETSDAAAVYPASLTQTATYNNLGTRDSPTCPGRSAYLTFDADGNLTSARTAQLHLGRREPPRSAITYPGQSGKSTAFGCTMALAAAPRFPARRRAAAARSPPRTCWCGARICRAQCQRIGHARILFGRGVCAGLAGAAPSQSRDRGIAFVRELTVAAQSCPRAVAT